MSLPSGTHLCILRGNPTPEQLAALILALDQVPSSDASSAHPRSSNWQRAARLESLGGAPLKSADDPRLHHQRPRK
jgi:acyl-CoA carboxylase epsilon subunit-like protein